MIDLLEQGVAPWEERIVVGETGPFTIERVRTQWDYALESHYLAHCLGTKDADAFNQAHRVFSLRDAEFGFPHATILTVLKGKNSPYGRCQDLGTRKPMKVEGERLRVLQVRGREDAFVAAAFLRLVVEWYTQHGGRRRGSWDSLIRASEKYGDCDITYHMLFLLDETVNNFTGSYDERKADEAQVQTNVSVVRSGVDWPAC